MTRTTAGVGTIDTERALIVFFLLVGTVMFALTFTFDSTSATLFPRLTAGVLIVGSVLLLVQAYLPAPIQRAVAEPVSIAEPDDEYESKLEETADASAESDASAPASRWGISDQVATFGLLLGYIGLSLLVGILWATPVFVLAYAWWFDLSRRYTAIVVSATLVIVFSFYLLLGAPLEDGILLEWIW